MLDLSDGLAGDIAWADDILLTSNFTQEAGVVGDIIAFPHSADRPLVLAVGDQTIATAAVGSAGWPTSWTGSPAPPGSGW